MPIYRLCAKVTVSAYTDVEAETLEEAIAEAELRESAIGGTGTGVLPEESWVIEDADGDPYDITEA